MNSEQAQIDLALAHLEELKKQQAKRERKRAKQNEYYLKNKSKILADKRKWRERNPDYMKNYMKTYNHLRRRKKEEKNDE